MSRRDKLLIGGISQLEHTMPTADELRRRREFYERVVDLLVRDPENSGPFPSVEEMIREDRGR